MIHCGSAGSSTPLNLPGTQTKGKATFSSREMDLISEETRLPSAGTAPVKPPDWEGAENVGKHVVVW